jgi:hypothetical protein
VTDYTTPPPPPPAGGPGPAAAGKDNSQLLGIIGAVLGFLCCPLVGIGLGIYVLVQARKVGGNPMWGYIAIGASVAGILFSYLVVGPAIRQR